MKRTIFLLFVTLQVVTVFAQSRPNLDSLKQVLHNQKDDSTKIKTLNALCWEYNFYKPDSADYYAQLAFELAKKINSKKAENLGYTFSWASQFVKGNYYRAIEIITKRLKQFEEENNAQGIAGCNESLFNCYRDMGDYKNALLSIMKAKRITDSLGTTGWSIYMNMGNAYERLNQLDSALFYSQRAYELAIAKKVKHSWISHNLGNVLTKLHQYELALVHYRQSLQIALDRNIYKDAMDDCNGIANIFMIRGQNDSVIFYSKEALKFYYSVYYPKGAIEAATKLAQVYKIKNNVDSTLKYFEISSVLKDSIYSQQKIMQVQNLAFAEQQRQAEVNERKSKEEKERRHNLQFAILGIGVISFVILLLLLSTSIIVRTGFIKFLGIVALLLVFEFLNLLAHPYLVKITSDSPFLMLLLLVCIAALLVPIHHRLEKWVTHKLTEKNKRIRLAAAKKTIETLEKKDS